MADYGDILSKSLKFAVHPKRWLPLFIIDAVFYSLVAEFLLTNLPGIISTFTAASATDISMEAASSIIHFISVIVISALVYWLVRLWVQGAITQQSANEKMGIIESFRYAPRRFLSLVLATIVVAIIGWAVGIVPIVGTILTIIVSIVLVFVTQGVMVSKLGFAEAIKNSHKIFRQRPGSVILAWLATSLVSLIIMGIFLLPAFIAFGAVLFPAIAGMASADASSFATLITTIMQNTGLLAAVALVFVLGSSIAGTFGIKSLTEFYKAWSKKKLF